MASLTIRIENHKQKFTVSEMRIRLAQVLSKLRGDQEVSFTFVAQLDDYQPAPRILTKPAILGAPYDFNLGPAGESYETFAEQRRWPASTHSVIAELREGENVVHGEFARPEND